MYWLGGREAVKREGKRQREGEREGGREGERERGKERRKSECMQDAQPVPKRLPAIC